MAMFRFLASPGGRWVRAIAGIAIVIFGVLLGGWGWLLAVVGAAVFAAGAFDFCLLAPLARLPFNGGRLRAACAR